jgi:hypothetical protein
MKERDRVSTSAHYYLSAYYWFMWQTNGVQLICWAENNVFLTQCMPLSTTCSSYVIVHLLTLHAQWPRNICCWRPLKWGRQTTCTNVRYYSSEYSTGLYDKPLDYFSRSLGQENFFQNTQCDWTLYPQHTLPDSFSAYISGPPLKSAAAKGKFSFMQALFWFLFKDNNSRHCQNFDVDDAFQIKSFFALLFHAVSFLCETVVYIFTIIEIFTLFFCVRNHNVTFPNPSTDQLSYNKNYSDYKLHPSYRGCRFVINMWLIFMEIWYSEYWQNALDYHSYPSPSLSELGISVHIYLCLYWGS